MTIDPTENFCSCIVPFHNEEEGIGDVLDTIKRLSGIGEIIGVDDGSDDHSLEIVHKKHSDVEILRHQTNRGKAAAIRTGLQKVSYPYLLLLDADLKKLEIDDLQRGLKIIRDNEDIDMLIFKFTCQSLDVLFTRGDLLLSGQRLLKTIDLQKVYRNPTIRDYQIETAINEYMRSNRKKVYWTTLRCHHPGPIKKYGLTGAIKKNTGMTRDIFTYKGATTFLKHLLFFARKKLPRQ